MKSISESRLGDDTAFVDKRDYQQRLILCTQYLFQPQNSRIEKKLVLSAEKEEMLLKGDK